MRLIILKIISWATAKSEDERQNFEKISLSSEK